MARATFKHWSKEDVLFLKNNYAVLPTEDIAKALNRDINCITNYVSRKNLKLQRYKKIKDNSNRDKCIEKIAFQITEALKEHSKLNIYSLQRVFYSKYIYTTEYSLKKALEILISNDLIEYFYSKNDNKSKNFRLKDK